MSLDLHVHFETDLERIISSLDLQVHDRPSRNPKADARQLIQLIHGNLWIGYDPKDYDPTGTSVKYPSLSSIGSDLQRVSQAGFTGVVTFGVRGALRKIPEIAKELHLKIIAGVWDPASDEECQSAAALADQVDGYCVGHNGLGSRYERDTLEQAILALRMQTNRPVTTTEEIRIYRAQHSFCELGDWIFPDCHISMRVGRGAEPSADLRRNVDGYMTLAAEILSLANKFNRPVMLKMVMYPWFGVEGATLGRQAEFFHVLLEEIRDPEFGLPGRVGMMYSTTYDLPWKKGHPFYPWDPFTGLLNDDGSPRPAVTEIVNRLDLTI